MYDLIIIGGGVSGLGAAIYAKRFGLKTAIIAKNLGGLITTTHLVENYPGFSSIDGSSLAQKFIEHAQNVETEFIQENVNFIEKQDKNFILKGENEKYQAKSIIFATGTEHRKLNIPGEKELQNRGVSYCATCDGPFFKDKTVAIIGGSDSAIKESLLLSEYCQHVYVIYRGEKIRPEPINQKRLSEKKNIEVITNTNVIEIIGTEKVEKIKTDTNKTINLQGVFIAIGGIPQTSLAKNLGVELNEKGEIIIDKESKTNIAGVFSSGDCTNTAWKQAIVGVAEGTYAAYSAFNYLKSLNI